jgi:Leucine-rich repeat (LRR) protein
LERDTAIRGIDFFGNSKISYLPVKINEAFPNLLGYSAGNCSIKTISKENFEGLSNLRELLLFENFIKKIPGDTFEDLVALEFVNLGKILT